MDMIKTLERMKKGSGEEPAIFVCTRKRNTIVIQLSKYFKNQKFNQQIELLHKDFNVRFEDNLKIEIEKSILLLQQDIDEYKSATK
jgi:hypothetical protein